MKREIFRNAPLIEMIAEVRWRLTPIASMPNAGIDPFYDILKQSLINNKSDFGYPVVQEIVPPEIPRELLAGTATTQFRKTSGAWPLFQLGPGLFTINMADNYTGWQGCFRDEVDLGIKSLYEAHPAPKMLQITSIKLIAIDAFSAEHGFKNYLEYSKKSLGLGLVLPESFINQYAKKNESFEVNSETKFQLKNLEDSLARVNISSGQKNNKKALILQIAIESNKSLDGAEAVMKWFDAAHVVHRNMFRNLLTEQLRKALDPQEVNNE